MEDHLETMSLQYTTASLASRPLRAAGALGAIAAFIFASFAPALANLYVRTGSVIHARLSSSDINTKNAQAGQAFTMHVMPPYPGGHSSLANARIDGHIVAVRSAGQGRKALLTLGFDRIVLPNGQSAPLSGKITSIASKSENTTARKALGAGVGAAVGSQTIGRLLGGTLGGIVGIAGGAAGGYLYANNARANFNVAQGAAATISTTAPTELRQAR
jgi:hypothetical protein